MMNNPIGAIPRRKTHSTRFLHDMRVGIVDKQGKPLPEEEYLKQIHLTVSLDAPQQEKKQQQTVDI